MLNSKQIVAHLVRDHSECARVFEHHRIDFCCKGNISVAAVARQRGIDLDALMQELLHAIAGRQRDVGAAVNTLDTPRLIAHIVNTHHVYLRRVLPFVRTLASKVSRVHGVKNPCLRTLDTLVAALHDTLLPHIDAEEQNLFPHLTQAGELPKRVRAELETMQQEHAAVGMLLERIREAAMNFEVPAGACNSYRTVLRELTHLESDIHVHIHLENNVLLPRFTHLAPELQSRRRTHNQSSKE